MNIYKAISFVSEHSVEYAVVAAARRAFSTAGFDFVPLYFWASREGGRESCARNGFLTGSLIAVFPRRPRVYGDDQARVGWKINAELHVFAREASSMGIPSFAALPVARNLLELNAEPQVHWLPLRQSSDDDRYLEQHDAASCALNAYDFVSLAIGEAVQQDWGSMVKAMSELR